MRSDRATIRSFVHRLVLPSLLAAGILASAPAVALQPIEGVVMVAAGSDHTCALTSVGGVKCWGANSIGQLGDNSTTRRPTPVNVWGLASGVAAIATGSYHTCALTTNGGVKCWGYNAGGQLGDNSTTSRLTPVDVSGLASGVAAIAAGLGHTCALTTGGAVKCWGNNSSGQLGDNSTANSMAPVDVSGLESGVGAITAGSAHACALTMSAGVKCWGHNPDGQLGDGFTTDRLTPVDVVGLVSGVAAIGAGGSHTCAVTSGGGVKCWGRNSSGQLGDNSTTNRETPVDVSGLASGVAAVAVGGYHTCALVTGGGAKCWGENYSGQLGDYSTSDRLTPVNVSGLASGVESITAGSGHTCAVTTGGEVKCWGYNYGGQLGDNFTINRLTPVDVSGLVSGVTAIGAGFEHTCALTTGGGVKCWGRNIYGELGDNSTTVRPNPVDVPGLASGVAALASGTYHTCALTTGGGVKCWGRNLYGALGDNTTTHRLTPVDVSGLASGVAAIAAGDGHTCAVTTGGGVKCWGSNFSGQLGDNSTTDRLTPADVSGLASGVAAISVGATHTCAVTTGGGVKCWGRNLSGQLGDNTNADRWSPVNVSGLASGVTGIAAGGARTCALTTLGGVKCWGGAIVGDNSYAERLTPVDVVGLGSGGATIAAGGWHACATTAAGGVKCWGWNTEGQIGDNSTTDRLIPVDVSGILSGATSVAAGGTHTCALVAGGAAKCWGWNLHGQLGDGTADYRPFPADVLVDTAAWIPWGPVNVSTRGKVGTGDNVMIGGFVIEGSAPKTVLITARGPSLAAFGVTGALPNPMLQLFSGQTQIAANDDWGTAPNVPEIEPAWIAQRHPLESAILTTLDPGAYTAIVSGVGGASGVGIVEIFESDRADVPLVNLSTRGQVLTGDDVLIGGFIIQGTTPKTVLVRARGPSMIPFGVANALANPRLQLFSGQTQVAASDDWSSQVDAGAIVATGLAPTSPVESAILITLMPGAYTAIVSGVGGSTGVGIVEVFAQ